MDTTTLHLIADLLPGQDKMTSLVKNIGSSMKSASASVSEGFKGWFSRPASKPVEPIGGDLELKTFTKPSVASTMTNETFSEDSQQQLSKSSTVSTSTNPL